MVVPCLYLIDRVQGHAMAISLELVLGWLFLFVSLWGIGVAHCFVICGGGLYFFSFQKRWHYVFTFLALVASILLQAWWQSFESELPSSLQQTRYVIALIHSVSLSVVVLYLIASFQHSCRRE